MVITVYENQTGTKMANPPPDLENDLPDARPGPLTGNHRLDLMDLVRPKCVQENVLLGNSAVTIF